jgi:hypothetical protein
MVREETARGHVGGILCTRSDGRDAAGRHLRAPGDQIVCVVEGEAVVRVGERELRARPGGLVMVDAALLPHRLRATRVLIVMHSRLALVWLALMVVWPPSAGGARPLIEPANPGWERFFELTWTDAERHERPVVRGRIVSRYGHAASAIKLLVDGLDASGQVVHQQVEWLGTDLGPFGSAPFEVALPRRFAAVRIRVFAFAWTSTDM